jgi:tricorn protease
MKKLTTLALALAAAIAPGVSAYETKDTRLLRFPDIHNQTVTFVYSGDIYIANTQTGESKRLTDHIGFETFPKFSLTVSALHFQPSIMVADKFM